MEQRPFDESIAVSVSVYVDDSPEPLGTYAPPATAHIDTTALPDGPHVLRVRAQDALGSIGVRTIPFVVQNGPGITVTGLRSNERVSGPLELQLNAFSSSEPFDAVRAESSGPIPVWTWVMSALIGGWAAWYGLTQFQEPAAFAQGNTRSVLAAANAPMEAKTAPNYSGRGVVAGFDYAAIGPQVYTANCAGCHGSAGAGVAGAFPALAGDPVVLAKDPKEQISTVLHGLHGKTIRGVAYAGQMPAYSQLTDDEIAAAIDHERTSWGNNAPTISPGDVRSAR